MATEGGGQPTRLRIFNELGNTEIFRTKVAIQALNKMFFCGNVWFRVLKMEIDGFPTRVEQLADLQRIY
jgi:hypothetical protein